MAWKPVYLHLSTAHDSEVLKRSELCGCWVLNGKAIQKGFDLGQRPPKLLLTLQLCWDYLCMYHLLFIISVHEIRRCNIHVTGLSACSPYPTYKICVCCFSKWTVFGNIWNTATPLNDRPIILVFLLKCCSIILKFGTVIEGHLSKIFM